MDNILSDNNHISYQIMQSVGVGSEAVLYTTEAYGLYAARELKQSLSVAGREHSVHLTGENLREKNEFEMNLIVFCKKLKQVCGDQS